MSISLETLALAKKYTDEHGGGGGGGTTDYNALTNKPTINGVEVSGNKTSEDYKIDSVQSDWNQNDESSPDYVKNRPFYTGELIDVGGALINGDIQFTESDNIYAAECIPAYEPTVDINNLKYYRVVWDGEEYFVESKIGPDDTPFFGNLYIMTGLDEDDTGEPFVGLYYGSLFATKDTSTTHNIILYLQEYPVFKVPSKYLYQADYNDEDISSPSFIKNKPSLLGIIKKDYRITKTENIYYRIVNIMEFNGSIYSIVRTTYDSDSSVQIYKIDKNEEWNLVYEKNNIFSCNSSTYNESYMVVLYDVRNTNDNLMHTECLYSSDGSTWNISIVDNEKSFGQLTFGNGIFICEDTYEGLVKISVDGSSWKEYTLIKSLSGNDYMYYFNGTFFIHPYFYHGTTTKSYYISKNGIDWEEVLGDDISIIDAIQIKDSLLAIDLSGNTFISYDGLNFNNLGIDGEDIGCWNGLYIIFKSPNEQYVSFDGKYFVKVSDYCHLGETSLIFRSINNYLFIFPNVGIGGFLEYSVCEADSTKKLFDSYISSSLIGNLIPNYTESDEGKILKIVGGVPTWVSLQSAEEVSF